MEIAENTETYRMKAEAGLRNRKPMPSSATRPAYRDLRRLATPASAKW